MSYLKSILLAGAGIALLGSVNTAQATAYAYGNINFTNLTLSGLTASGVTLGPASISTRDSAGYPGSTPASNAAGATNVAAPLTGGSDVGQAFSGLGTAPAENTYSQALLTSPGATRGDAQLVGNLLTGVGTGANDVSEGRIVTPGTASSTAGTTTGFNVIVTTTGTTSFTLSFNASDSVIATTTNPLELASASVSASFSAIGVGNTFSSNFAPSALNTSVTSTAGTPSSIINPSAFYTTTVTVGPGTYQLSLLSGAQEQVTAASPAAVPEPMTLTLLGSGLVAVGALRRRRQG